MAAKKAATVSCAPSRKSRCKARRFVNCGAISGKKPSRARAPHSATPCNARYLSWGKHTAWAKRRASSSQTRTLLKVKASKFGRGVAKTLRMVSTSTAAKSGAARSREGGKSAVGSRVSRSTQSARKCSQPPSSRAHCASVRGTCKRRWSKLQNCACKEASLRGRCSRAMQMSRRSKFSGCGSLANHSQLNVGGRQMSATKDSCKRKKSMSACAVSPSIHARSGKASTQSVCTSGPARTKRRKSYSRLM
ncbi:hypothetical protein CLUG_02257 [Clavispora lusitaniae ATCC 42720]|uniref:Uncharacterized protein n=1 Tax=Clavispora lusitaniae (strain ATCC 42720) TaxID=306902 RepID=C4Y225_CLAL4|nr:uncharacterized protein CLUG_02257 [Clavispora lusitaniae ATCC 42720]EEQ38134.1 hypothetical protein CLUG_02257 [Clavispora lusitaniae ATCC 42720]